MKETRDLKYFCGWLLSASWRIYFDSRAFKANLWKQLALQICNGSSPPRTGKKNAGVDIMHPMMVLMIDDIKFFGVASSCLAV